MRCENEPRPGEAGALSVATGILARALQDDDDVFAEGAHSPDVGGLIHVLPELFGLYVAAEPAVSGVVGVYLVVFAGVDVDRAAAGDVLGRDRHAVQAGAVVAGAGRTVGIGCGSWKGSRAGLPAWPALSGPRRMASWRPAAGPGQAQRRPQ